MENKTFEVGIVMAGAISAGAYSAGVMDFIIEALDAYYAEKDKADWDGPRHDVRVPVLAGASAGGMTAAIAALHAFRDIEHIWPGRNLSDKRLNRLYSSWVTDIDIKHLLEITDVAGAEKKEGAKSLLCCDVLDRIVDDAFRLSDQTRRRNWTGRDDDYCLRVLLTVTNLRGVPYSFELFESEKRYGMLNHGDFIGFIVGIDPRTDRGFVPLDVRNDGLERDLFKAAALATGAFPIGLKPRELNRKASDYVYQELSEYSMTGRVGYQDLNGHYRTIDPDKHFETSADYRFLAVDGGTIDNEPLEFARRVLAGHPGRRNKRDGDDATKAVLLIDPFPNLVATPGNPKNTFVSVVQNLFSTLIDQARFKPEELRLAASEGVFSRFAISPQRPAGDNELAKKYPIASGVLGGFGGFLHESFRRHDYLLGRRNAQAFLRWHFGLPHTNHRIFGDFDGNRQRWYVRDVGQATDSRSFRFGEDRDLKPAKFLRKGENSEGVPGFPIIPLVPSLCEPIEIGSQDLPCPYEISLDEIKGRIRSRASTVVQTVVNLNRNLQAGQTPNDGGLLRQMGTLIKQKRGLISLINLIREKGEEWSWTILRAPAHYYGTRLVTKKAVESIGRARDEVEGAFRS